VPDWQTSVVYKVRGFGAVCGSISVKLVTTLESTGAFIKQLWGFLWQFVLIHPGLRFYNRLSSFLEDILSSNLAQYSISLRQVGGNSTLILWRSATEISRVVEGELVIATIDQYTFV
jgi:hypothetical protein